MAIVPDTHGTLHVIHVGYRVYGNRTLTPKELSYVESRDMHGLLVAIHCDTLVYSLQLYSDTHGTWL